MNSEKKRGRPSINGRIHPNRAAYRYQLNIRACITTSAELTEKLNEIFDDSISVHTVRKWESDGWPPDRFAALLKVLGIDEANANDLLIEGGR